MKISIFVVLGCFLLCNGCVTSALWSVTDERPEVFEKYTNAWIGNDELVVSYRTKTGLRWNAISLNTKQQNIFKGKFPVEEREYKREIPIVIAEQQQDFSYYPSRFNRNDEQLNQLGNLFLVGNHWKYRDQKENIYLLIEPIGNISLQGTPITKPRIPNYQPLWTYPARAIGTPLAVCLDIAILPLFFVSKIVVRVKL